MLIRDAVLRDLMENADYWLRRLEPMVCTWLVLEGDNYLLRSVNPPLVDWTTEDRTLKLVTAALNAAFDIGNRAGDWEDGPPTTLELMTGGTAYLDSRLRRWKTEGKLGNIDVLTFWKHLEEEEQVPGSVGVGDDDEEDDGDEPDSGATPVTKGVSHGLLPPQAAQPSADPNIDVIFRSHEVSPVLEPEQPGP